MFWTAFIWGLGASLGAAIGVFLLVVFLTIFHGLVSRTEKATTELEQKMLALLERNADTFELLEHLKRVADTLEDANRLTTRRVNGGN